MSKEPQYQLDLSRYELGSIDLKTGEKDSYNVAESIARIIVAHKAKDGLDFLQRGRLALRVRDHGENLEMLGPKMDLCRWERDVIYEAFKNIPYDQLRPGINEIKLFERVLEGLEMPVKEPQAGSGKESS